MSLNFDFWVPPYDYHPPLIVLVVMVDDVDDDGGDDGDDDKLTGFQGIQVTQGQLH